MDRNTEDREKKTGGGDYRRDIYDRYLTSRVREAFDHAPSGAPVESGYYYFEAKLARWLPPDRKTAIIDLGCGSGALLSWLHHRGYQNIRGIDLSPEQVARAGELVPGVEITRADLFEYLPGREGHYGLIVALDILEHLDKGQVLKFMELVYRSLAPEGALILQTPNAASPWGFGVRWADFTHECCFTPRSLGQLLNLAGFAGIEHQAAGPVAHGAVSLIRSGLWKAIELVYGFLNLVEMGTRGEGIYTRVFQSRGVKPAGPRPG